MMVLCISPTHNAKKGEEIGTASQIEPFLALPKKDKLKICFLVLCVGLILVLLTEAQELKC
jgi:hypothetical protein